jgi:tetratricopeptide (TPR) repeat protein
MTSGESSLSRFTPSLMPHALLERLFVARDRTLDAIMARLEAAEVSTERNHTLLVGPRGAGKTHLVSLVYHRLNARRAHGAAMQVAWLPEDPWTIVSYRHLLSAILERLEPAVETDIPGSPEELETHLRNRANEGGPIVVLIENLDQILDALGNHGQQQLRHILQTDRSLLLVATSTRLDRSLADQASPFYGFFTTTRLEPFDVDEAATMLKAIAEERGDQDVVTYLQTREGQARLRTIAHLAGGQPRMWAALASALTVTGLDELLHLLLTRFDDLTPYYQEQLGRLSGHQRLVVAQLAEIDHPISVIELANRLDIDQRSLGKTLSDLVDRGWASPTSSPVTAFLDQRRTYYELAEPLARLSFQIKESRGKPLRLVVEFLKSWFDPSDLGASEVEGIAAEYLMLASTGHNDDPVIAVTRRLQRLPITRAPALALLGEIDEALDSLDDGDPEQFLRLPSPVRAALEEQLEARGSVPVRLEIHRAAQAEVGHTHHPAMVPWIMRTEAWVRASAEHERAHVQLILADWLGRAWRFDEAMEVIAAAAPGLDDGGTLITRLSLTRSYSDAGRINEAIPLLEDTLVAFERVLGPDHPNTLASRNNLAHAYRDAGQHDKAIALHRENLTASERVLGPDHPNTLISRNNLAYAYRDAGQHDRAITLLKDTIAAYERALGPDHPNTLISRNNLAATYQDIGQNDRAIALHKEILAASERVLGPDHPNTLASRSNLATAYQDIGQNDKAITLHKEILAAYEHILGPDHPDALTSRNNLAIAYQNIGQSDKAITLHKETLAAYEHILGPDHPDTLTSRNNLATAYQGIGQNDKAIALHRENLTASERVLSTDHPSTQLSRDNLAAAIEGARLISDTLEQ